LCCLEQAVTTVSPSAAQHHQVSVAMLNDPRTPPTMPTTETASSNDDWTYVLARAWMLLLALPLLCGGLAYGGSFLLTPAFTARTSLMPPQQQQSAATSALASLSGLVGLSGASAGLRNPVDQFAALMQSQTIQERLIERFKLLEVYDEKLRSDARRELDKRTRIAVGKRDGLITVEVDDPSPQRAAEIANAYVEELRRLTSTLAVSEAQQRRVFFEGLLNATRSKLTASQIALEQTGVSSGTLRSEPKAAAETYSRLKAQVTASEVRLQAMRTTLTDNTNEVRLQMAELGALRGKLASLEGSQNNGTGSDYIGRYRDFKYQETLFELFARQYELARVDESREGALIQVVDTAVAPDKRSWPRRSLLAAAGALVGLMLAPAWVLLRRRR
jgi:uncharacterized protein involved in exopolysaccharide biosynthesis